MFSAHLHHYDHGPGQSLGTHEVIIQTSRPPREAEFFHTRLHGIGAGGMIVCRWGPRSAYTALSVEALLLEDQARPGTWRHKAVELIHELGLVRASA